MSTELTVLTLAALLQILQFAIYAALANRDLGPGYTMSARDRAPSREMTHVTARLGRAYDNHIEWLLLFAIAIGVTEATGQNTDLTACCAWLYLVSRVAYVPAYAFGLRPWRTVIWAVGFLATSAILLSAFV